MDLTTAAATKDTSLSTAATASLSVRFLSTFHSVATKHSLHATYQMSAKFCKHKLIRTNVCTKTKS